MANVHCRLEDKLREEQIPARVAVHERHLFSIYETMRDEKTTIQGHHECFRI